MSPGLKVWWSNGDSINSSITVSASTAVWIRRTDTFRVYTDTFQCNKTSDTTTITVKPIPLASITPLSQAICNGAMTSAINFNSTVSGTVFNWVNQRTDIGLSFSSESGSIPSFSAINATAVPLTDTLIVTPTANGCSGTPDTFMITVNPTPHAAAIGDQSVCNNTPIVAVSFTGDVSGQSYSWTNDNSSIGLASSGNSDISSFTATNTGTTNELANIVVTPAANSCNGPTQSFTVTVKPTPTVVPTADQTLCNNSITSTVTFTGGVSGTIYNWTNDNSSLSLASTGVYAITSFTATNSGTSDTVATIIVTPTANSCGGASDTFSITVHPTPNVTPVSDQTVCNNLMTATVAFGGGVSGTTYNWTNTNSAIGLPSSGTGDLLSFSAANTGTLDDAGNITVTPTAHGCDGVARSFNITVHPTPKVAGTDDQTLCNSVSTIPVAFTGAVSGTVYNWTNDNSIIGLSSTGSGDIASFAVINNRVSDTVANIIVTPTASGCVGISDTFSIIVHPTPIILPISNQAICNNNSTTAVTFTSSVSGTGFSWTNSDSSIGITLTGTGDIASFTAINAGTMDITATIAVSPMASGCPGATQPFTITVHPTPDVLPVADLTLCNNATTTGIVFLGRVSGTVCNWSNNNASIGLASSDSGNIMPFMAINNGTSDTVALIVVTPVANGCIGSPDTFHITVRPTPNVVATSDQAICNDAPTTALIFTGGVSETIYNWTNDNSTVGLAGSGTGNIASFTALNTGTADVAINIVVSPVASGCPGIPDTFSLTVHPTPTVALINNQIVCNNQATTTVTFSGAVAGTIYNWTNDNTTIGLASAGSGTISAFVTANTGTVDAEATIVVTPAANGCAGNTQTFSITVHPTPNVVSIGNQVVCNTALTTTVSFTGGITGTVYNWSNDNSSVGLASAGAGSIAAFAAINLGTSDAIARIIVTPTASGCPGSPDTFSITVHPTPDVVLPAPQVVCNTASATTILFSGAVTGTNFGWTNDNATIGLATSGADSIASFVATDASSAPIYANITVTPTAYTCVGASQIFTITVNPTPLLSTTLTPTPVCDSAMFNYFQGSTTIGTAFAWSRAAMIGISTSAASGVGNIAEALNNITANPLAVVYVDTLRANGCVHTQNVTVVVNPKPKLTSTLTPGAICDSTLFNYFNTSATIGTVFTWTRAAVAGISNAAASGMGDPVETLVNTTAAAVSVVYVDTLTANGCVNTQNVTVVVNPRPVLTSTLTPSAVCDSTLFHYLGTSSTAGTYFAWSRAIVTGISNAAAVGVGDPAET